MGDGELNANSTELDKEKTDEERKLVNRPALRKITKIEETTSIKVREHLLGILYACIK
jgi:hypothetical protein